MEGGDSPSVESDEPGKWGYYEVKPGASVQIVLPDWYLRSDGIYAYQSRALLGPAVEDKGAYNVVEGEYLLAASEAFTVDRWGRPEKRGGTDTPIRKS